jgi:hypothetical protein
MRSLILLALAACTSSSPLGSPRFDSVKDRLASEPTRLFIAGDGSSGSITAARLTHDGWDAGATPLSIANGELVVTLAADKLSVPTFDVQLDPIDIPESVFGKPAQLRDVRVILTAPATSDITWHGDDDASATITLSLDLSWSLYVDGGGAPLGTQHLPPIAIDVALSGAGDHVDTTVTLHAAGDLWSWAGILKLSDLELSLSGMTLD